MKIGFVFSAVLSLFAIQSFAANGTMKGDGSAEKPFQIEDYEDLKAIGKGAYLYSSDYVLTKDIDASASKNEMCNADGCNGFISIGKNKDAADSIIFWGNIDGQNHTISNLNIWLPCERDVAFISYLGGSVSNLNFDHSHVTGRVSESNYVATVAAKLMGTIKNVKVTNGFVQGQNYVGGIVGHATDDYNAKATIADVSFQGTVKGSQRVGGIVGQLDMNLDTAYVDADIIALKKDVGGIAGYLTGYVNNSRSNGSIVPGTSEIDDVGGIAGYSKGMVYSSVSLMNLNSYGYDFDDDIGGIVGDNEKGGIMYSYSLGNIEGESHVGGAVGNGGYVYASFAMGSVKGKRYVGGIAGSGGKIIHSYAAASVQGNGDVGGLVGYSPDSIFSSYWNAEISGIDSSAGGVGLTTAQMLKWESYAGWDTVGYDEYAIDGTDTCFYYEYAGYCSSPTGNFIKIWDIDEGKSFPYLKENRFSEKALVPIAIPTVVSKWQEIPVVASLIEVDGELVGKWTGSVQPVFVNDSLCRDSLYYGYRIGAVVGTDTVWGTSSYVAIPNKIEISTFAELQKIGHDIAYPLLGNYELTADIDAKGLKFEPIGDSVHIFYGTFDGKNHTIKNLVIDEPTRDFTGMFGYVESGVIQNLTLENTKVVGSWVVGALIGESRNAVVSHVVSLNGDVRGEWSVGGLIGYSVADSVVYVGTTGKIKGTENVGGIIAYTRSHVTLTDAFSVNVIKGHENVGGIIGNDYDYSFGDGMRDVYRVYSASMFKAPEYAAEGILGDGSSKVVDDSTCFFDSTVAGIGRKGKTTEEMLLKSTYKDYDFETAWEIQEGVSYPYFKGMDPILPGTLVDDGTVNVLAGAGTEIDPYKIYDYDDLKYIGKYEYGLDAYYKLMGNIDATISFKENCNADSSVCKGFEPIGEFGGVFIGNNKIIAGLNINRPDEDSVGLFRTLAKGAKVSGIVFDTASHFGESYSYGYNREKGVVRGKNYVGVLAGVDNGADIERIYVKNKVLGGNYVGGIVGKKTEGSISLSASRDTVSGVNYVGGLVGGLVSSHENRVSDCYSLATVLGEKDVGGLIGYSNTVWVENSFGAGNVVGTSEFGGITGKDIKSVYTSVYYDSTIWLVTTTAMGELRNTQQMVKQETYKDWDFKNTWKIAADTTYPYLTWITKAYYIGSTIDQKFTPDKYRDSTMMHLAGSGTESDPFIIKTYSDLKSIGLGKYKLSSVYRLGNDIDASASKDEKVDYYRSGFKPIGLIRYYVKGLDIQDTSNVFTGKIHGAGHTITGLYIYTRTSEVTSFIDSIGSTGVIDSLTFKEFESHGTSHAAAIASTNEGTIKNVSVFGNVEASDYGAGLVEINNGVIENASYTGLVYSGSKKDIYTCILAGFVRENNGTIKGAQGNLTLRGALHGGAGIAYENKGTIESSRLNGDLHLGADYAGGIVAKNEGVVSACTVSVSIESTGSYVGGIAGFNRGTVSACSVTTGIETSGSYVGGLIGKDDGIAEKFEVSGTVKGLDYVGGFIGEADGKKDFASLHTAMDVTGRRYVGGLFGMTGRNISKSYATGNVKGTGESIDAYSGAAVGGLVGLTSADVDSCYSTASVEYGAGLIGVNRGTITNSNASGKIVNGAGLVGDNRGVIRDCYTTVHIEDGEGFVRVNNTNAVIENCHSSVVIESKTEGAGFVNYNTGTISKCYATGSLKSSSGWYVAGFAVSNGGTITDSYTTIDIENGDAGFVNDNELSGVIERCYATGSIRVSRDGAGGFVFRNDGTIRRSFATGDIFEETENENIDWAGKLNNISLFYVGGFASVNNKEGVIEMCFATGDIKGRFNHAGAFAGNNKGAINNSYSTGNLKRRVKYLGDSSATASNMLEIGSFVGYNEGKVDYDYATGYFEEYDGSRHCSTRKSDGGGVAFYYNSDSCAVTESAWVGNDVSSADLRKKATFKGFDFDSVWYIKDGESYPLLRGMPNVPNVGKVSLNYGKGGATAEHVVGQLLDKAIVADTSYALVIEVESASKALLDSLERLGKNAGGEYVVDFRVGVAVEGDTLWSKFAKAEVNIDKTTGVRAREIVVTHSLGAAFRDGHVALRFVIPDAGAVKFSLMDMQGRIVKAFDLGRRAAGEYFETVAAEGIGRGRYIGVLQVNGRVTDRALLLKK